MVRDIAPQADINISSKGYKIRFQFVACWQCLVICVRSCDLLVVRPKPETLTKMETCKPVNLHFKERKNDKNEVCTTRVRKIIIREKKLRKKSRNAQ